MKKFVCPVCGYVYEGEEMPADFKCPVCKVPGSKFIEVKGEMKLAAEHEFGIYDKTVANNPDISDADKAYILEQLKANFAGECSEVGMYLCMARIAHREGYPEVGLYWEKAAYEEAEHAAKFAELLGSRCEPNMKADNKPFGEEAGTKLLPLFVQKWKTRWKFAFRTRSNSDKAEIEKVEFMRSGFSAFLRCFVGADYSSISFTLR